MFYYANLNIEYKYEIQDLELGYKNNQVNHFT